MPFFGHLGQNFIRGATALHPCLDAHPRQPLHTAAPQGYMHMYMYMYFLL